MKKYYNKLVRDGLPEIIKKEGKKANYRKLSERELKDAIMDKLLEEVNELRKAKNKKQMIEEMADIATVLLQIRRLYDISEDEMYDRAITKIFEKGSFSEGIFLESVED